MIDFLAEHWGLPVGSVVAFTIGFIGQTLARHP